MSMIRELFNGYLQPADSIGTDSEIYQSARDEAYVMYQKFLSKLEPGMLPEYENLMDKQLGLVAVSAEEGFTKGFAMGVQLIMEIMQSH